MPTSLYTEVGLGLIVSSFGKLVLMDQVTRSGTRLRFARFLVELEAATPIEREVTFDLPGGTTFTRQPLDRGAPRVASPPPRVAASVVILPPPVETSNPFGVFSDTREVDIEAAAVEEELPVGQAVGDEVDVPTFPHSRSPTRIGGGTHVVGDDFALEDGGVHPPGEEGLFPLGAGVPSVSSPERSGEHTSNSQAYNIT
ncbi:hypothetical protein Droror1_Dr00027031 [Drosera rotundifolia]